MSMAGAPSASLRHLSSHRQALEYASSLQTFTLEKLMEYRTGRGTVGGSGDIVGIGRGTAVDTGPMFFRDKAIRDGGCLPEAQVGGFCFNHSKRSTPTYVFRDKVYIYLGISIE